jgi:type II pantothenate kinase
MRENALSLGVDIGATLAKIALANPGEEKPRFEHLPSANLDTVAAHVIALEPARVGLTGGGAAQLADLLDFPCERTGEFDAWGAGALKLLPQTERGPSERDSFLLVSLGTGTSVLHVQAGQTTRVGGTGIGGGTVVGLGAVLAGVGFKNLCALAERGDSAAVDLRISDIYGDGEFPLADDLTAANFGKLARELDTSSSPAEPNEQDRANRAAGVMRLVGETVALLCAGAAATTGAEHVVYGGSTLRGNTCLVEVLTEITTLCGLQSCYLPHGGFAGALGALEIARSPAGRGT